jgi:hypothetical protein
MARWSFKAREWLADRTSLQYPRVRPVYPAQQVREFRFSDFVIAMKGLALAAVCLIFGIALLFLCCMMVYAIFVGLTH